MNKTCNVCKLNKPLDDFYICRKSWGGEIHIGRQGYCKGCNKVQRAKWLKKNLQKNKDRRKYLRTLDKTRVKNSELKSHYGITLDDYNNLIKIQDNKCKICDKYIEKLCIDHCHTTGKVRGLLCKYCNSGLGFFKDSLQSLKSAIQYLEEQK